MKSNAVETDKESVGKTARTGIAWSGVAQLLKQPLDFGISIVTARLLSPNDFGVMSAIAVLLSFVFMLTSFGFSNAIIQRSELNDDYVGTAQTLSIALGCLSTFAMALSAQLLGRIFHSQVIGDIIPTIGLIYLISSFSVVPTALITREIEFNKLTVVSVVGTFVYGCVAISMALNGYGVWSLVVGTLMSQLASTIVANCYSSCCVRFRYKSNYAKELFHYGGFVTISSLLNNLARNADNLIIGRYLGTESLGYYARAYTLATLPKEVLGSVIGPVLFPSFARIQHDSDRLSNAYYKSINAITLMSLPICIAFYILASELILTVYGIKWAGSIAPFKILCIAGYFYSVYNPCNALLLGLGKMRNYAIIQLIYSVMICSTVFFARSYSIEIIAIMVVFVIITCFALYMFFVHKIIRFSYEKYWNNISASIYGTLIVVVNIIVINYLSNMYGYTNDYVKLVIEVITSVILYIYFILYLKNEIALEIYELIKNKTRKHIA